MSTLTRSHLRTGSSSGSTSTGLSGQERRLRSKDSSSIVDRRAPDERRTSKYAEIQPQPRVSGRRLLKDSLEVHLKEETAVQVSSRSTPSTPEDERNDLFNSPKTSIEPKSLPKARLVPPAPSTPCNEIPGQAIAPDEEKTAQADIIPASSEEPVLMSGYYRSVVKPVSKKSKRSTSRAATLIEEEPPRKRLKIPTAPPGTIERQNGSCINIKYQNTRRCVACVSKKTGEPCRFKNVRAFKISKSGMPTGPAIWHGLAETEEATSLDPVYNEFWYRKTESSHIQRVMSSVARVLLPVLREERERLVGRESMAIRRRREMDVRVTCDRCLTSIFATSYLCTMCGREICLDCYSMLETSNFGGYDESRLVRCGYALSNLVHGATHFLPVCRLDVDELDDTISEMSRLLPNEDEVRHGIDMMNQHLEGLKGALGGWRALNQQESKPGGEGDLDHQGLLPTPQILTSDITQQASRLPLKQLKLPITQYTGLAASPVSSDSTLTPLPSDSETSGFSQQRQIVAQGSPPIPAISPVDRSSLSATNSKEMVLSRYPAVQEPSFSMQPPHLHEDPAKLGSLPFEVHLHSELTEENFRSLWSKGETMVITGLLDKMEIKWTPEYFIEHYGPEICSITDCDNERKHGSTVKEFFEQFGQYETRGTAIHKLKDWPPSEDFKNTFPTLFNDFHRAVPAPNYTRRDGFYNIAAHFPTNVVAPDMGPKMYNAFASRENGYGSTRLHMDMADAVNIMLYSAPLPGETQGMAVWDIYPATSSGALRTFLKEEFPVETSPVRYVDPIHSQYFYLTPTLRRKLYERYKVRSWRIYQKPGDAVFIPAGCAHQVCNLADCIKVAVDFVSPENLDRCGQLTKEFRNENDQVIWKEDILQLSNMCWSAWENTRRLTKGT